MDKLRILIYGDHWKFKSGYAREIRDVLPYLRKNNDVRQVSLGYNGYPIDKGMVVYHTKTPEVKDHYAQEVLHYAIDDFQPDIVLTVQDFWILPKISFTLAHPAKLKWVHWGTLDSEPLDFYSRESLKWMHYCFWQSHFGAVECKMVMPKLMGEVIYPSVDPKVFHKLDKEKLKKQFKLSEFNILICNARGQQRKNVPVLLDAFKQVLKELPNTVLILSSGIERTKTDSGEFDGYDLERFVTELGLTDYVLLPRNRNRGPIDDKTLNIQYNLADINILACFSQDTKIVTQNGLKHYSEIKKGDLIFTLNPKTNKLELCPVKKIYKYLFRGRMVHFKNKQVDLLVTPNHRIYYSTPKKRNELKIRKAFDFITKKTRYYLPSVGKWEGKTFEKIIIPQKLYHPNTKLLPIKMKLKDLFEIIGWYISEGHLDKSNHFTCISNSNYENEIMNLFKKCGFNPYRTSKKRNQIGIYSLQLFDILKDCGMGAKNKTIPDWCLKYSPKLLKHLYKTLMLGDGSRKGNNVTYYTVSDKLKDKFVELCFKLGYSTKVYKRKHPFRKIEGRTLKPSESWAISIREINNKRTIKPEHISTMPYQGIVWCVKTKNNTVITERNGLITVSGNSWGEGFGLPFIEAGISGVPSIGVDCSAVHEIVRDRGILVKPRAYTYNLDGSKYQLCHPDDLKDAIIKLLKDEKLRKKYGKAAEKFAKRLTPESRAKLMLDRFKKLIKENAQPAARR